MDWSQLPTDDPWATARAALRILRTSEDPWTGITSVELDIARHLIDFLQNEIYNERDEAYRERCRECIRVLGKHHHLVIMDWSQISTDNSWELIVEVSRIMRTSDEPWRGIELTRPDVIPSLTKFLKEEMQTNTDENHCKKCRRCLQVLGEHHDSVTRDWPHIPYDDTSASIQEVLSILRGSYQPWKNIGLVERPAARKLMDSLQYAYDAHVLEDEDRKACMKCLCALGEQHIILPTCFISRNVINDGRFPVCSGGSADIWKGTMEEKPVCLKVLRVFSIDGAREELLKDFYREALVWRQLRHRNVLPFLGVTDGLFAPRFCLISPWMENGDIISFLQHHPSHDRLSALCEIAEGIRYLHELDPQIVHGAIRGANILVNNELHCCLGGFGLSVVAELQTPASSAMMLRGSVRWLPPEMMDYDILYDHSYAMATDVYSFGCTIIEIYTGKPPFWHIRTEAAVIREVLIAKTKPPRPSLDDLPSEAVWQLVETCLSTLPRKRPTATIIHCVLRSIQASYSDGRRENWVAASASSSVDLTPEDRQSVHKFVKTRLDTILKSTSPSQSIQEVPFEFAQPMVDILQAELDSAPIVRNHHYRSVRIRCLYALGKVHGVIPASLVCADVSRDDMHCRAAGGFADVFRGTRYSNGTKVCLKYLRVVATDDIVSIMKMLCHEALLWRQLQHPNILRFLGVSFDMPKKTFCLISPWLKNGNIRHFLRSHADHDRFQSILEIAEGISYLHAFDPPIVHSDIKGANILVADDGHCVLADFGIMVVVETHAPGTTTRDAGSRRWMPPEMLDPDLFNPQQPFTSRDVYSFGCTIIEIYTDRAPFAHINNEAGVLAEIVVHKRVPPRPIAEELPSDELWNVITTCLSRNPGDRPTAASLLKTLHSLELAVRQAGPVSDAGNLELAA